LSKIEIRQFYEERSLVVLRTRSKQLTFHAIKGKSLAELGGDDEEDALGVGVLDLARFSILGLFRLFLVLVCKGKLWQSKLNLGSSINDVDFKQFLIPPSLSSLIFITKVLVLMSQNL
jgi:hypothetical protein